MSTPALTLLGRSLRLADQRNRWFEDPAIFAADALGWPDGQVLAPYQSAALADLAAGGRLALRSPHGAGKSTTAALAVLWFACTREVAGVDWKILTTAGSWHQLQRYLWPEIHLWAKRLRFDLLGLTPWQEGRQLFDLGIKLDHGQAFAAASNDPGLLEGMHADSVLVILDEAKSISPDIWDAVEGALSGTGQSLALATSTPGAPSGRFYEIATRRPGLEDWHARHVTLDEAMGAGRISATWAAQRAAQWGVGSAVYQNRVLGEFAAGEADGVIPLAWIEAAVDRWHAWQDQGRPEPPGRRVFGVDVAAGGADMTVVATCQGHVVLSIERYSMADTMETTGRVMVALTTPLSLAVVDSIGVGAGVLHRLREQKATVSAFNAAERPTGRDLTGELGFLNRRAEAWWRLRERLDPATGPTLCLPPDDGLIGDLTAPRWSLNSSGKVQVEGKAEIRKRLGRSTDAGDAVMMALSAYSAPSQASGSAVPWSGRADPSGLRGAVPWADLEGGSLFTPDDFTPARDNSDKYAPGTWESSGLK